ncbi:hypothetical protein FGB62_25g527 [Gracilaria domingensis]|nr:hypothetical protein FGB62_25g527 [Gracilaria domingensis]
MSFGSQRRYVYISLSDASNDIHVLSSPDSSADYTTESTLQTRFESPIFGMWPVFKRNSKHDEAQVFTFVISRAGEVVLIDDSGHEPVLFFVKDFELSIDQVLCVSQTDSDCISIIGQSANSIRLCVVRFLNLETAASISITCSSPVLIADPSAQASDMSDEVQHRIIDFALKPTCLCVLYEGGYVCFFELQVKHGDSSVAQTGMNFFEIPFEQHKRTVFLTAAMYYALVLRPSLPGDEPLDKKHESSGFIKSVWDDFFAIGYGRYISVWDQLYVCGHGYARVRNAVQRLCSSPTTADECMFVSENGLHELQMSKAGGSGAVSLGMAVKRKGVCEDLVDRVAHGLMSAPLRSHPLSVAPIKAAADADSEPAKLFEAHVLSEDEREDNIIRNLLTKSKTPSAESVLALVQDYTKRNRRSRHDAQNMGLRRVPSERLAAATTARCLYELEFGDLKFLVPLVDMLETGVVSSEAVLAVADISDAWDMGAGRKPFRMRCMIDPLMQRVQYSHGLEAVIRAVVDLPEQDVVKVLRYASRLADAPNEEQSGDMLSITNVQARPLLIRRERARRLFEACLECAADSSQAVHALRRLPFSDTLALLTRFKTILTRSTFAPAGAPKVLADAPKPLWRGVGDVAFDGDAAASYRGIRDWVGSDKFTKKRKRRAGLVNGCISWACNAIDAHLSTLILDESGRELAEQLLQAVKHRRRESEHLMTLQGLAGHLANGKGVASGTDGLYKRRVVLVPRHVALL